MQISRLLLYLGVGLIYSALAFRGELLRRGALIFSKQNVRPLSSILMIHLEFLTILWGLIWFYPHFEPLLPIWLTDDTFCQGRYYGRWFSLLDCLEPFAMIGMAQIERRWMYVECETDLHR